MEILGGSLGILSQEQTGGGNQLRSSRAFVPLRSSFPQQGRGSPRNSTYPISSPASICLVLKKAILGKRRS